MAKAKRTPFPEGAPDQIRRGFNLKLKAKTLERKTGKRSRRGVRPLQV